MNLALPEQTDWLIVGAGFTGAVVAECIANELGQRVVLIDRRAHLGGNAYDSLESHGLRVHHYGPHIFHTNSQRVWEYLSRFTAWRAYEHRVKAMVDDQAVPLPFNLNALNALFPHAQAARLEKKLVSMYGFGTRVPILKLRDASDPELRELAEYIYAKVYLPYTLKQWGVTPTELDPSVTARVPIAVSRDDRYFQDTYQAMPADGYEALFARMLDHPLITVRLNTELAAVHDTLDWRRMLYTGPLDAFFAHQHGHLPYRSLRFEHSHHAVPLMQEVAVVNHPDGPAHTRVTEFKHLTGQTGPDTVLCTEYPEPHRPGFNEPYYPVLAPGSRGQLALYREAADRLAPRVLFAGRLADYQYYNMDQAVARALTLFRQAIAPPADPALNLAELVRVVPSVNPPRSPG